MVEICQKITNLGEGARRRRQVNEFGFKGGQRNEGLALRLLKHRSAGYEDDEAPG